MNKRKIREAVTVAQWKTGHMISELPNPRSSTGPAYKPQTKEIFKEEVGNGTDRPHICF